MVVLINFFSNKNKFIIIFLNIEKIKKIFYDFCDITNIILQILRSIVFLLLLSEILQ